MTSRRDLPIAQRLPRWARVVVLLAMPFVTAWDLLARRLER